MSEKSILKDADVRWDEREGRPRKVRGEFALPLADSTEDSIKAFLQKNADELQFWLGDEDLQVVKDVQTAARRVVRYQQYHDGIPVFGATVIVQIDKSNRVKQLDLGHVRRPKPVAAAGDQKLTAAAAKKTALDAMGDFKSRGDVTKAEETYYPTADGLKLAYLVMVLVDDPAQDWRIFVDAFSGEILEKKDVMLRAETGQGYVFDPNPVVTAQDNTYRDPTATVATCGFAGTPQATIDAERVTRDLLEITKSGANYRLEGPYVEIDSSPEETDKNNFKYTSDDDRFEAVNAYYHIDTIQRYIQSLGITNAHNSKIDVIHHAPQSYASYSWVDDTIRLGHSGTCNPDRGEDGEVMLHEYGHAIQHDQVPGWGTTNPITLRNETGAMGEGFGDILACAFFAPEHQYQQEVFEDWIFGDSGGLRRVDGTKIYPGDWTGSVHSDGEIWSAALWNIYLALGGSSAIDLAKRQVARKELLQTLIQSHDIVAANASMPDGAEAFMDTNVEDEEFLGRNLIDMVDSFHDRGILDCAAGSDLKLTKLWGQQDNLTVHSHENFEYGQDNWFYAEVKNDGTEARAFVVVFSFKCPFSSPVYPSSFRDDIISGAVEFNLAAGATRTVHARFPKDLIPAPPANSTLHGCMFAEVYNPVDHVPAGSTWATGYSLGKLRYRNTHIIDLVANDTVDYFFDMGHFRMAQREFARLEVIRPSRLENLEISFHHRNPLVVKKLMENVSLIKAKAVRPVEPSPSARTEVRVIDPARISVFRGPELPVEFHLARGSSIMVSDRAAPEEEAVAGSNEDFTRCDADLDESEDRTVLRLRPGRRVGFPYEIKPRDRARMNMKIRAPRNAKPGDRFTVEVVQRNRKGELLGGFDIQINIVERK